VSELRWSATSVANPHKILGLGWINARRVGNGPVDLVITAHQLPITKVDPVSQVVVAAYDG
jgi:hypothetical protein